MTKRDLLIKQFHRTAKSVLPEDTVVATKPDHPFLFSGPDVLIGSRGALLAAFFVKTREISRPKELTARLVASRLALPEQTKCVVVLNGTETEKHSIFKQFDFVFEQTLRPIEITQVMSHVTKSEERRSFLSKVRRDAYVNYSALLHVHRLQSAGDSYKSVSIDHYKNLPDLGVSWHGSKEIRKYNDSLIGMKRTNTRSKFMAAIYEYSIQTFNENYSLHEGVPEPNRMMLDVAMYTSPELYLGRDPEKPLRVAAFSGWLLTDPDDLFLDIDFYLKETRRVFEKTRSRIHNIQSRKSSK